MAPSAPALARALAAMRVGDEESASTLLEACLRRCPEDSLAAGLLERLRRGPRGQSKDDVELC